jgi:hypothetical protein
VSDFRPSEILRLEGVVRVEFVKDVPGTTDAIIKVGSDTQVVSQFSLNR